VGLTLLSRLAEYGKATSVVEFPAPPQKEQMREQAKIQNYLPSNAVLEAMLKNSAMSAAKQRTGGWVRPPLKLRPCSML